MLSVCFNWICAVGIWFWSGVCSFVVNACSLVIRRACWRMDSTFGCCLWTSLVSWFGYCLSQRQFVLFHEPSTGWCVLFFGSCTLAFAVVKCLPRRRGFLSIIWLMILACGMRFWSSISTIHVCVVLFSCHTFCWRFGLWFHH
jgi:hypothetical protein